MKQRIFICALLTFAIMVAFILRTNALLHLTETEVPFLTSVHTELQIRIPKGTWSYEPNRITLQKGDRFTVTITNEDDIVHGFAIDVYGINETIPPHSVRRTREFLANTSGIFNFYCSVMCGEGVVATGTWKGTTRGHFDMEGVLLVTDSITNSKYE
jgi:heme/copper-type cytochrome/quinol oxidase subunit 2